MAVVEPGDLRAAVYWLIEGAAPRGISLALILGELRDFEPSIKTVEVLTEIEALAGEKRITSTGDVAHGTRRFHPGRA